MKGSPALEITGAIRNNFSDRDHQDSKGVDGQWWAGNNDVPGPLVPAALCREPSLPWPSRGQSQQMVQESVLLLGFNFHAKVKGWKSNRATATQLLVPPVTPAAAPACDWVWGRSWEHGMWGNGPISAKFGSAYNLRNPDPFKALTGSSPAEKKNSKKQRNSADVSILKDPGRTVLHLVYASRFLCTSLVQRQKFSRPAWKNIYK